MKNFFVFIKTFWNHTWGIIGHILTGLSLLGSIGLLLLGYKFASYLLIIFVLVYAAFRTWLYEYTARIESVQQQEKLELSDIQEQIMKSLSKNDNKSILAARSSAGVHIYFLGGTSEGLGDYNQEEVGAHLDQLVDFGLMNITKYNSDGEPIYRPTKNGFDYISKLN